MEDCLWYQRYLDSSVATGDAIDSNHWQSPIEDTIGDSNWNSIVITVIFSYRGSNYKAFLLHTLVTDSLSLKLNDRRALYWLA
jgi:hypothetical protein